MTALACNYFNGYYASAVWSVTVSEEHMITVSENRMLTLRILMSYIYGAPILDVSRSHTTTHHSR